MSIKHDEKFSKMFFDTYKRYRKKRRKARESIWKKLFHLPFDPVWNTAKVFVSCSSIVLNIYLSVDAKCVELQRFGVSELIYVLDALNFIDVVLSIGSLYVPNLNLPETYSMKSLRMLLLELVSTIPFELVVTGSIRSQSKIFCALRLNRSLRIVPMLKFYNKLRKSSTGGIYISAVVLGTSSLCMVMLTYAVYCNIECNATVCDANHLCSGYEVLRIITAKISTVGLAHYPRRDIFWELTSTIASLITFVFLLNLITSHTTIDFVHLFEHQVTYVDKYNVFLQKLKNLKTPDYILTNISEAFLAYWKQRRGYSKDTGCFNILPSAITNEILMDLSWPALEHSKLFRSMDMPFLRQISLHMRREFYHCGEFLYQRNEWKHKMFYVESGTIQLLSEEDGESPILSLTNGTCIGESTLIISYRAINSIRCKTACELLVLEKKDFIQVYKKFYEQYKHIHQVVTNRYREAIKFNYISELVKAKICAIERQVDIYNIFWIKNTLHKLMSRDAESTYRHEFQNIYILNEIRENELGQFLFSAEYLDMLAISERIETDTDTVFVRTRFPCILQPTSVIVIIWEALIIFLTIFLAFVMPSVTFLLKSVPDWYYPVITTSSYMFWCDVYVQVSTGVKTRHGMTNNILKIVTLKLQTFGFWMDMFSCIPCEIFTPIVLKEVTNVKRCRMHLNRLLKLWRLVKLFELLETRFNANLVLIRFIKFSRISAYAGFVLYCSFHNIMEGTPTELIGITVQSITGLSLVDHGFPDTNILLLASNIVCSSIILLSYASIVSAYILRQLPKLKIQRVCYKIFLMMKEKGIWDTYQERIKNYISTTWEDNQFIKFKYGDHLLENLSKILHTETYEHIAGDTIRSLVFFQCFSKDLIMELCFEVSIDIFPPNETISYAGDLSNNMYIITEGTIEIIGSTSQEIIDTTTVINLFEACFGLPVVNTCISKTHCRILVLSYDKFNKVLNKYPIESRMLKHVISSSGDIKREAINLTRLAGDDTNVYLAKNRRNSFCNFGYKIKVGSFEEYDYYIPFDRFYPFEFMRYFLWRFTILPDGPFLYIWESFRCAFAILGSIVYFVFPLVNCTNCKYLFYCINLSAFSDLYVRLHVCYYDDKGILITHPLKTATHYIEHGFIIDLVAAFPLDTMVSTQDYVPYFVLNLNRFLQLHRYIQFFGFLQSNIFVSSNKFYDVAYFPLLVVLANYFGSLLINFECKFSVNSASRNISCESDAVLSVSSFVKPIEEIRAHFLGVYIVMSILTTTGIQGFKAVGRASRYLINSLSILAGNVCIVLVSFCTVLFLLDHKSVFEYKEGMKDLSDFMAIVQTSRTLKKAIVESYEVKWYRMEVKHIWEKTKLFNNALRTDILYDFFGRDLFYSSVFANKKKSAYQNLVAHLSYDIILTGGYLETINNICGNIYFLHKGVADVLAADGTKLATLYPGSIFGNLENASKTRLLVSVIATSHVEYLFADARKFQEILQHEHELKEEFLYLKTKYVSYIPATLKENELVKIKSEPRKGDGEYIIKYYCNPNSMKAHWWNTINLFASCYVGIILECFQLATTDLSATVLTLLYISDLSFALQAIVRDRMAYVDEYGYLITNLKLITEFNRQNKWMTWLTFFALLPVDVVIFVSPIEMVVRYKWMGISRINRLLKLAHLYDYFSRSSKNLNVDPGILSYQQVITWFSLLIVFLATVIGRFACMFPINIEPTVPECSKLFRMSTYERLQLFMRYVYVVANCMMVTSQHIYFPQGLENIILFIFITLICYYIFIKTTCHLYTILCETYETRSFYKNVMDRLRIFLYHGHVSASLNARVWNYLKLLWIERESAIRPRLLYEASPYLTDAILNNAFSYLIKNHPIFERCHADFIRQVVHKFTSRYYFSGDYVQFKGSVDDSMYFIFKGEINVLEDEYNNRDHIIAVLKTGNSFGILQGLFKIPHSYSYITTKTTILLKLSVTSWDYLLQFFPASRESIYNATTYYEGY